MDIVDIAILDIDRLERKHDVRAYKVEEVLLSKPRFFLPKAVIFKMKMFIAQWDRRMKDDI